MTSVEHVTRMHLLVIDCGLSAPDGYWHDDIETLAKIYNGCGPDWLPSTFRDILTDIFEFFEPAFLIHDCEFEHSDRSRDGFDTANRRLLDNCRKLVAAKLSWWTSPVSKARYYWRSWLVYRACQRFGWSAWCDATPVNAGTEGVTA